VAGRDVEIAQTLLMHGADPNARWCVPVQVTRRAGTSKPMPGCTQQRGTSPLMLAASLGAVDMIGVLVQHEADPALLDWEGKTALGYAAQVKRDEVAEAMSGKIRTR
jgi:ankyrin repeat protein